MGSHSMNSNGVCLMKYNSYANSYFFSVVVFFPAVDRYGLKLDLHAWLWNESKPIDCYFDRLESQICTNVCGGVRHSFFLHRIDSRADKRTNVLLEERFQRGCAVLEYSKVMKINWEAHVPFSCFTHFLPHFFLTRYSSCERQRMACVTIYEFCVRVKCFIDCVKHKYQSIFITSEYFIASQSLLSVSAFSKFEGARESTAHPKSWSKTLIWTVSLC